MAMAHDDLWEKFDLLGEGRGGGRWEGCFLGFDINALSESSNVPDISDILFDSVVELDDGEVDRGGGGEVEGGGRRVCGGRQWWCLLREEGETL